MPCSATAAAAMFHNPAADSFASEWIAGKCEITSDWVQAYMNDLPAVWVEISTQLLNLDVQPISDATKHNLASSLAECDITVLIAHHVQREDLSSVGIEFVDGVLPIAEIQKIAPKRAVIVDLLGVCRSESLIPIMKHRCSAARVIARQTRVDPIMHFRLVLSTLRQWRRTGLDYIEVLLQVRMAMLNALGVWDEL